jgi:hypothetical protein
MKPTAVEFAVKQLEQLIPFGHQLAIRIILEQAKEMEKQQIIDAYKYSVNGNILAEQYYNETFNK